MTKKDYMKPTMQIVELKHRAKILTESNYGMGKNLNSDEEVDDAW